MVAVDDVQWLDEPSASALAFSLRRLGNDDVRFVLAQRVDGGSGPTTRSRRYPEERVARIEIGPLSFGATSAVLIGRFGTSFALPTLRRVHEASGGNPFCAVELARALLARGGRVRAG